MRDAASNYQSLWELSREIAVLNGVSSLLHWDQETYMPSGASASRAEQLSLISQMAHARQTSSAFRTQLSRLIDLDNGKVVGQGLTPAQAAAVREWRRDYRLASLLPEEFVKRFATLTSEALEVWKSARSQKVFGKFAPFLQKILDHCRQKADYFGWKESPYNALIDEHEPYMTRHKLTALFSELVEPLSSLRREILRRDQPDDRFLHLRYSQEAQDQFARELLKAVGFTDQHGRMDLTAHPFCSAAHPTDGRLTTRIDVKDPMSNFLAVLHEGGHFLYERSLPEKHFGTPLCQPVSLGLHESQSRFWETRIGKCLPFWKYYFPQLKRAFPKNLEGVGVGRFYRAINTVTNTPIRVEADEVSYCLHVALRFELESALIEGKLDVKDLPKAWNAKMKSLLDIEVKNDKEGCLQDIHWSLGAIGYFPTYALGNLYAAHFFEAFASDEPNWEARIAKGEFAFLREWLQKKILCHGRRYTAEELLQRVCGTELSPKPYLTYLQTKYLGS